MLEHLALITHLLGVFDKKPVFLAKNGDVLIEKQ